jgi:hypothetical protein
MFPRADGIQILKVNGNYRAMVHLLVVNLSPYLDLCLEPLKVTIDPAIDCTSKSYVVSRSTVETVNLQGALNGSQSESLRKVCETNSGATMNCRAVFLSGGKRIEKGFTFENGRIKHLA